MKKVSKSKNFFSSQEIEDRLEEHFTTKPSSGSREYKVKWFKNQKIMNFLFKEAGFIGEKATSTRKIRRVIFRHDFFLSILSAISSNPQKFSDFRRDWCLLFLNLAIEKLNREGFKIKPLDSFCAHGEEAIKKIKKSELFTGPLHAEVPK
jgi:hypothetical protein|tara:strand:- start:137 stop:586 length:450 start_codon:yes stop_codon:yes gene_type:complete